MRFLCRVAICTPDRLSEHPWIALPEAVPMNNFRQKGNGGEKGIRTPERVNPLTVFETAAFDHSAISPD